MDLVELPGAPFERHPWEVARADFFISQVLRVMDGEDDPRVLDAGAGDGWFAIQLARACDRAHITCYDPNYELVAPTPVSDQARVEFTATRPGSGYAMLTLLDVLEHIEQDATQLAALVTHVRPGGHVLISVPAWQRLYSAHDVALGHFRRYMPAQARSLLRGAGLVIERDGGLFHSLLVARAAQRIAQRVRAEPPECRQAEEHALEWPHGSLAGRVLTSALRADATIASTMSRLGWCVPGLSWWSMCRKL